MDIQEIRRKNLQAWVDDHSVPSKEKSYFSQILSGDASFGERAARRIERDYGMRPGALDDASGMNLSVAPAALPDNFVDGAEIAKLVTLYTQSNQRGRAFIMDSAEVAHKQNVVRLDNAAND